MDYKYNIGDVVTNISNNMKMRITALDGQFAANLGGDVLCDWKENGKYHQETFSFDEIA
jgi:hypothetical protein